MTNLLDLVGMDVDAQIIMWVAGFILSMCIFGFSIVKVLDSKAEKRQDRMEERHQQEMGAIHKEVKQLHSGLSEVREMYVKQETHDKDIERLHRSFTDLRAEVRQDISAGVQQFTQGLSELRKEVTELLLKVAQQIGKSE